MKTKRQQTIINIIENKIIETQEELQNELLNLGYDVTQSTVSRDIKELKLIKGHDTQGNYRYIANTPKTVNKQDLAHYMELFSRSVKSTDYALNNVVVKCHNGMASSACVAIDEMFNDMMVGSLAGDDTIIIVTKSESHSLTLLKELNKLI